ncbi:class IV adenylate cyclase [Candidatus Thorarchaeota archaeon]|jgi:adenylate cyclase class 2|nr:MAG: class IV adenylate cyclase [Candidatus Thorarchaeota archaeon]
MVEEYEVEIKLPVSDIASTEETLLEHGAVPMNSEVQRDTYYDHPCRSLGDTDEAVRIRDREVLSGVDHALAHPLVELTYKGPKVDSHTKTREEYSVGVFNAEGLRRILLSTGFVEVATVVKKRRFFDLGEIVISLDDVADVGSFIEFESLASGKVAMEEAREKIVSVATKLGFDTKTMVRESYLEMYLKKR